MISNVLSEEYLRYTFIDDNSPYRTHGFALSLHDDGGIITVNSELTAPSYSRAVLGHGPGYWSVGARRVVNTVEIDYPRLAAGEVWRNARSVALWSVNTQAMLWSLAFDELGWIVTEGDRLMLPAGGLVMGFA